jgi:hypothetical protein
MIRSGRMRWTGNVECMEDMRTAEKVLVNKYERKKTLKGPRHTLNERLILKKNFRV